eukprot:1283288-Rhodomonas_salina.1
MRVSQTEERVGITEGDGKLRGEEDGKRTVGKRGGRERGGRERGGRETGRDGERERCREITRVRERGGVKESQSE